MKQFNQTTLFLILTFVISFSMAAAYQMLTGSSVGTISYTILGATYMFVPALSVVIVKKLIFKEKLRSDMPISFKINKWFFAAWLIMPLSAFLTLGVSLLFPGVSYNPDMTGLAERFASMTSPEQLEEMKVQLAALPMSPIWLILLMGHNYPQHPQIGVLMMTLLCILLTPLLLYFTIKSKSVIAAAIAHGTMNATATISIIPITSGNDLLVGMPGLAGMIAVMILTIGLFMYDRYISKENIMTEKIISHL